MFRYRSIAVGATLALLLCGPASARPIGDGGMLGGTRLGGPSPESYSPGLGQDLMKNGITFVLGSDGPGPSVPPEAEFEYELPVDDAGMLIAQIEGGRFSTLWDNSMPRSCPNQRPCSCWARGCWSRPGASGGAEHLRRRSPTDLARDELFWREVQQPGLAS